MTHCEDVRELLMDGVFGELDDAERMRLERHLIDCAACRAEERQLIELREAAREPVAGPSPALRAHIMAAHAAIRIHRVSPLLRPVPAYVAIAAAGAAALITAMVFAMATRTEVASAPREPASAPISESMAPRVVGSTGAIPFSIAVSYATRVGGAPSPKGPGQDSL